MPWVGSPREFRNGRTNMKSVTRYCAAVVISVIASPLLAQSNALHGEASIVDGDTLRIGETKVRLFGIDAPEFNQKCDRDGARWACGEEAKRQLQTLVEGRVVFCRQRDTDPYGRVVAVCHAGETELNRTMVANGWAVAFRQYADDYVADEVRARADKAGLWKSSFMLPSAYRQLAREAAAPAPRPARVAKERAQTLDGCLIKGNHSRRGEWIYHVPGMPYYAETRAEAMFCSEAEAQAAGYRRARVR